MRAIAVAIANGITECDCEVRLRTIAILAAKALAFAMECVTLRWPFARAIAIATVRDREGHLRVPL